MRPPCTSAVTRGVIHQVTHQLPSRLLRSKHGIYYFRIKIPAALRGIFQRDEIRHSLRTGNLREAGLHAVLLAARYYETFQALRASDNVKNRRTVQLSIMSTLTIDWGAIGLRIQSDPTKPKDGEQALKALEMVLQSGVKPVPQVSAANCVAPSVAPSITPSVTPISAIGITLAQAIEAFLSDMGKTRPLTGKARPGWDSEKAKIERPNHLNVLLRLVGDRAMSAVDREVIEDVWSMLQMLPPNFSKSPRWRDKPLVEIVERQRRRLDIFNEQQAAVSKAERVSITHDSVGLQLLAASTINNYAGTWSAFFEWATHKGYALRDYAAGLQVERDRTRSFRRGFTAEELKAIFEGDYFRLAQYDEPAKFWIPILMLYSGARINELTQLVVDDIDVLNGIPCILIWDDDADKQRLKNRASRRLIPIHPTVIALGFLDYVETRRKSGARRLFVRPDGNAIHRKYLGNWWGRFLTNIGVKDGLGVDAHAFRHTTISYWMNAHVKERFAAAICGHGYGDKYQAKADDDDDTFITYKTYGRLYRPDVLLPYVTMLDYGLTYQPYQVANRPE